MRFFIGPRSSQAHLHSTTEKTFQKAGSVELCRFRKFFRSDTSHRTRRIPMKKEQTILIDGVRYYESKPACRKCFFWKNRKAGCTLGKNNCYYLAEAPKKSPCDGCCYGPCVSFCMRKVLGQGDVPANA